jgi:hypothetical protein
MRKVTREIVQAWANYQSKTIGNTSTDGQSIYLHGNRIAWRETASRFGTTLAGWNTVTTRERLNGLLWFYGIPDRFAQRNFEPAIIHGRDIVEIYENDAIIWDIDWQCEAERADNLARAAEQESNRTAFIVNP